MPNDHIMQVYAQGFYFEDVNFKQAIKMFGKMEVAVSIYEGVL